MKLTSYRIKIRKNQWSIIMTSIMGIYSVQFLRNGNVISIYNTKSRSKAEAKLQRIRNAVEKIRS